MTMNFHKIKELICKSTLSQQDQDNLVVALSLANDAELEPVAKLFFESHEWIEKMSMNLKAKQAVAVSQNPDEWRNLLAQEESELKKLES